jgi:hypothetical protein
LKFVEGEFRVRGETRSLSLARHPREAPLIPTFSSHPPSPEGFGGQERGQKKKMQMHAQIGGKLAQLGVRLIDSTAKKLDGEETRRRVLRVIGEAVGNTASAIV